MKKVFQTAGALLGSASTFVGTALAAADVNIDPASTNPDIRSAIEGLITDIAAIAGLIAVAFLVYGGIIYITGGAKGADTGKTIIANALIGVAIIALSYALVSFVVGLF